MTKNQDHLRPVFPRQFGAPRVTSAGHVPALPTGAVRQAMYELVSEAKSELAHRKERVATEFFGQQAGVPGQGPEPELWHEPAGAAMAQFLHPTFGIVEREYRALPEQGWFSALLNPQRPVEFQLGAFDVPKGTTLWLTDYQFQVFRPSGIDAGDFIVAEAGRFSNQLGFDVAISGGRRKTNISYQLDPQPVFVGRPEFERPVPFEPGPGASDPFNNSAARQFASTASPSTALLPRRPNVQGPRGGPFTLVVDEQGSVALNVVIFNQLRSPVAAISGRLAGWLLQTQVSAALINRVRPR